MRLFISLVTLMVVFFLSTAPMLAQGLTENQVVALQNAGKSSSEIQALDSLLRGGQVTNTASLGAAVAIPRKTIVQIKVDELLSSKETAIGPFKCIVDRDVKVGEGVVIAEGTAATCRVVSVDKGGMTSGKGSLKLAVDSVTAVDGTRVVLDYQEVHGGGRVGFGSFKSEVKVSSGTILPAVVDEKVEVKPPLRVTAGVK